MARREVTNLKPGVSTDKPPPSPPPRLALNIMEFCEAVGISEGMFYKIRKKGRGPREAKIGTRTVITMQAANEWLLTREAAVKAAAEKETA